MTEKIDTQGMSGEAVKGCMDNVYPKDAAGNPIYKVKHYIQYDKISMPLS